MYIQLEHSLQNKYLELIKNRAEQNSSPVVRYLNLGPTVIRVLCFTEEAIPLLEKNFTYVLREHMDQFNSTIAIYKEQDISSLTGELFQALPLRQKIGLKAEMMYLGIDQPVIENSDDIGMDLLIMNNVDGVVEAFDENSRTYYYGIRNFDPEDFIKFGHCFVRLIKNLVKSKTVHLVHGAVMGNKGTGFLLCGKSKRGKSTLTVHSMLQNFEFVSDDYQLLEKTDKGLLAYPIYSVITLSHRMYHEMYHSFKGKFVCNTYGHDKFIFNISAYHDQFRTAYPVRFCLFPEITADDRPSIQLCEPWEKGRAIVHILHSTTHQTHSLNDSEELCCLFNAIKELPFYKINLCKDISANTEYLKDFLETNRIPETDPQPLPGILKDISFGLATFLDTGEFKFYSMNKFATDVYRLLSYGVPAETIRSQLEKYTAHNPDIGNEFEILQNTVAKLGLYDRIDNSDAAPCLREELAKKSGYHLSVYDCGESIPKELLRKKEAGKQ